MAERRIMNDNIIGFTDESFEVDGDNYHLFGDNFNHNEFNLYKNGSLLVTIYKDTSTSRPLSCFEEPADSEAIQLAIDFLKKKYQS